MFSDRFEELCALKGVKPGRACAEMGVSRGLAAKWKATGTAKPSADVLEKMSKYFGLSINEILSGEQAEKAPIPQDEHPIDDNALMFALWGDTTEMDEDDLEDVKRYAAFVRERKQKK